MNKYLSCALAFVALTLASTASPHEAFAWGPAQASSFAGWVNNLSGQSPIWPPTQNPSTVQSVILNPIAASNTENMGSLLLNVNGRVLAAGYSDANNCLGGTYLGATPAGPGRWIPGLGNVIELNNAYKNQPGNPGQFKQASLALLSSGDVRIWGDTWAYLPTTSITNASGTKQERVKSIATSAEVQYFLLGNGALLYASHHQFQGQVNGLVQTTPLLAAKPLNFVTWDVLNSKWAPIPVPACLQEPLKQIDAGVYHALGLRSDGKVIAWGNNLEGQVDPSLPKNVTPSQKNVTAPVVVAGLGGNARAVACSHVTSFALMGDGTVKMWGRNLANNSMLPSITTVMDNTGTAPLTNIMKIWGARQNAYFLRADGVLFGIGVKVDQFELGMQVLGQTTKVILAVPANVNGTSNGSGVLTGCGTNPGIVLRCSGTVNYAGTTVNFNSGATMVPVNPATLVAPFGMRRWAQAGGLGAGIDAHGRVWMAGSPIAGSMQIVNLATSERAIDVTAHSKRVLILLADGTLRIVGSDIEGHAGTPGTSYPPTAPGKVTIPNNLRVIKVKVAETDTFVILDDGSVWHRGRNHNDISGTGVLGPIAAGAQTWARVRRGTQAQIDNAIDIAVSTSHALALDGNGAVYVWGTSASGAIGQSTSLITAVQMPIIDKSSKFQYIKQISAGTDHSMALTDGGNVYCWGGNQNGQLGVGTPNNVANPVPQVVNISGTPLANIKEIAGGRSMSYFLRANGNLLAAGSNAGGCLTGSPLNKPTPSLVTPTARLYQWLGMEYSTSLGVAIEP